MTQEKIQPDEASKEFVEALQTERVIEIRFSQGMQVLEEAEER